MKLEPSVADLTPSLSGGAAALDDSIDESPVLADDAVSRVRARIADLAELAKLRLNFLVLVTTMVGYSMVPGVDWTDWRRLLHTLLGTALTAASASILNQYVERPWDGLMNRTRRRPLPAGRIAPMEALALGVVAGILGLAELYFFVNALTAVIGAITLGSYILIYTPLKRVTTLCTIVGAVPGALPPVMGVAAAAGTITPIGWALFGILFFWQMPHFLAIAILYREDYARGGFKMLPVVDEGLNATSRQMVFYALALIPVTLLPTLLHATGAIYFVAALLLGLVFLSFALVCVVTRRRGDARQVFLASILYLPCLLGAMMLDKI
jgi:protoheme IX farnesyltransferase